MVKRRRKKRSVEREAQIAALVAVVVAAAAGEKAPGESSVDDARLADQVARDMSAGWSVTISGDDLAAAEFVDLEVGS